MINSGTSFHDSFNNQMVKNCDILIKDNHGNTLLTKSNITQYRCLMRNNFLCSPYPTTETTIDIVGWKLLSDTVKTYLTTKNNILYVYYVVENIQTLGARMCFVDDWYVDYKNFKATINAIDISKLDEITARLGFTGFMYLPKTPSEIMQMIIPDISGYSITYNIINSFSLYNAFRFKEWSKAEIIQNMCIACGATFRFDYTGGSYQFYMFDVASSVANYYTYNPINIHDDLVIEKNAEYTTNVVVNGGFGGVKEVYRGDPISSSSALIVASANLDWGVVISTQRIEFTVYGTPMSLYPYSSEQRINDNYDTNFAQGEYNNTYGSITYTLVANGCEIVEPARTQYADTTTVIAYLIGDTHTLGQISKVQDSVEKYRHIKKQISFTCRLDPTIEPLDTIYVDGFGMVVIEEMDLIFNGGYNGTISGKLIDEMIAPSISSVSYTTTTYSFNVYNNNMFSVDLYGKSNNTSYNITTVNGLGLLAVNETTNPELMSIFNKKALHILDYDLTAYFKTGSMKSSEVVLLTADEMPLAPVVSNVSVNNHSFKITNPNSYPLTLVIEYSSGTLMFNMSANEQRTFASQDVPQLDDSFDQYHDLSLSDDVYCYFENPNDASFASDNSIILEANA